MHIALKNIRWRRIGVAVSILWFIGFAWFLWPTREGDSDRDYYMKRCNDTLRKQSEYLQEMDKGEPRNKMQDRYLAEHAKCQASANTTYYRQIAMDKKDARWLLSFDYLSVVFGWLLVWCMIHLVRSMIGLGRWVKRTFSA